MSAKDEVVIQEYIEKPLLIEGSKFDLRLYVLVTSLYPLRIYLYKEGLCRLATTKYCHPSLENIRNDKMHLTNYAINKFSPDFQGNKHIDNDNLGHKRSYTATL
jgi:tubulin polyglutamylase TTLL6/13